MVDRKKIHKENQHQGECKEGVDEDSRNITNFNVLHIVKLHVVDNGVG